MFVLQIQGNSRPQVRSASGSKLSDAGMILLVDFIVLKDQENSGKITVKAFGEYPELIL